jgi:hypothetical protein
LSAAAALPGNMVIDESEVGARSGPTISAHHQHRLVKGLNIAALCTAPALGCEGINRCQLTLTARHIHQSSLITNTHCELNHFSTHPVTHSLTHPFTHSPIPSLTHSPTYSTTHPLTHSPTHPLTHSPTRPLTHSPTHRRTNSPTQPLTHVPTQPRTHSPTHQLSLSATHPFTHSQRIACEYRSVRSASSKQFWRTIGSRCSTSCTLIWSS